MDSVKGARSTGMVGLGDLPGGIFESIAFGVSADGSVIVGDSASANGTQEAFRWTAATGMVGLGDMSCGIFISAARGISADGSVIAGFTNSANGDEAFRWTEDISVSTDTPIGISDNGKVVSTITIDLADAVTIADVNVTLDITHTRVQDLDVFLIAPDGTRVELFTDVGGNGDNVSSTTLDDVAPISITLGVAPFAGSFRPEGSLAVLNGKNSEGNWSLEVTDDKRRETGTLNSWAIEIVPEQPAVPTLSIDDVQLAEGDDPSTTVFTFTVTRSGETTSAVTVDYATADGSATVADSDYDTAIGTLNFAGGQLTLQINVTVNGDTFDEGDQEFFVNLTNPSGTATITDPQGKATILNDDAPPTISKSDATVIEGDASIRFIDAFIPPGSGGLDDPRGVTIGPDGNVYVAASNPAAVLRFDGQTGSFLGVFADASAAGFDLRTGTALFGPDGNLYVIRILL